MKKVKSINYKHPNFYIFLPSLSEWWDCWSCFSLASTFWAVCCRLSSLSSLSASRARSCSFPRRKGIAPLYLHFMSCHFSSSSHPLHGFFSETLIAFHVTNCQHGLAHCTGISPGIIHLVQNVTLPDRIKNSYTKSPSHRRKKQQNWAKTITIQILFIKENHLWPTICNHLKPFVTCGFVCSEFHRFVWHVNYDASTLHNKG